MVREKKCFDFFIERNECIEKQYYIIFTTNNLQV